MSLYYRDTAVLIFGILPFGWLNKRAKPLSSLHQQDLFALHGYHMALHFNLLINSVSINITPAGFRTTHRQTPKPPPHPLGGGEKIGGDSGDPQRFSGQP